MSSDRPVVIATRGSALALAQSNRVLADLQMVFPYREFRLEIIRTTGDKLQTASLANPDQSLPKGLFTKELEVALLEKQADLAVHSLKDLPTELPEGLTLGAVGPRADVRDVLLYRDAARVEAAKKPDAEWRPGAKARTGFKAGISLAKLPAGTVIATSSTRRGSILKALRPDFEIVPIRGNVGTRLAKLWENDAIDATILAAAGLTRLHYDLSPKGELRIDFRLTPEEREQVDAPPAGIMATVLEPEDMLPAVGQGAIGIETRSDDPEIAELVGALNHFNTAQAVIAERSFLKTMGGGCQSPVAAYARLLGHQLHLRAAVFHDGKGRFAEAKAPVREAERLGRELAEKLK